MLIFVSIEANAQHRAGEHDHPVMSKVDVAFEKGRISLDQKVLFKFYAGLHPEKLPSEFRTGRDKFVKCGTPAHAEYQKYKNQLAASTIAEVKSLTDQSFLQAQETYISQSGKFRIIYYTEGDSAVAPADTSGIAGVPDFVEFVAEAADSSYRHEVENLGYTNPIPFGEVYDVEIVNFGFYGQTVPSGNTTFIEIHNTFQNFPPNTDPEGDVKGAIKATMAHELKHAVQYAATRWTGESDLWAEMDATLMEEVVYDNVNDYYNYLTNSSSIFQNPRESFYPGSYYHVSWALFFEQKYGPDFWPNVWSRIKQDPENTQYTEAMALELGGSDVFQRDYIESHLWHLAAGADSREGYGFEEKENYPQATTTNGSEFVTRDFAVPKKISQEQLNEFSATYYKISSDNSLSGELLYELIPSENTNIGLIAFFEDGNVDTQIFLNSNIEKGSIVHSNWNWDNINSIGIVLANPNTTSAAQSPFLFVGAGSPDQFTLSQNYPNPFNPTTEIRFSLQQQTQVQLKIYDITGRLIRTLVDETRPAGIYQETFEGSDVASGIYFYRLTTDQQVLSKKMTLIK